MFRIEGLDKLSNDLEEATKVLEQMGNEIGEVSFDPNDPGSIDQAIQKMNRMIDEGVSGFDNNPILAELTEQMKSSYRGAILEKAAAARLEGSADSE